MSPRYMRHLHLPDKVIGWLDTAAVRAEIDRRWEVTKRGRRGGDLARGADSGGHGVSRRDRSRSRTSRRGSQQRVVGQKEAVSAVARRLVLNKGPLKDGFDRPDGVLLFLGPTGVGKTELAKAVAEFLFGDEKKMIRIDMSEYQDGSRRGGQADRHAARHRRQRARRHPHEPAEGQPVLGRAARRGREGEPEPAEPVPAGVRRRLADRRPRQARVSERRGRHHDVEPRLGALPEADQPARVPVAAASASSRCRAKCMRELERRFPPEFRNRIDEVVLFAPLTHDEVREIARHYLAQVDADARARPARRMHDRRRGARAARRRRATAWRSARAS